MKNNPSLPPTPAQMCLTEIQLFWRSKSDIFAKLEVLSIVAYTNTDLISFCKLPEHEARLMHGVVNNCI